MGKQNKDMTRTEMQNEILHLEKKYFNQIFEMISSSEFMRDLLIIEKEIKENYPKYRDTWDLKNKIKIPAERLVRQHTYMKFFDNIKGIYPSPVSSDIGIKLDDAILCIDVKTLDTVGNKNDIKSTAVEKNQTSFLNTDFPYIPTVANLDSIDHYSRLPVLTYVIKIIYTDDNYSFELSRGDKPTIVVACIPNGELSKLFGCNIIENFKTYEYYSQADSDKYTKILIPVGEDENTYAHKVCVSERGFMPIRVGTSGRTISSGDKTAFYDPRSKTIWWVTSENGKKYIKALKSGSSTRFYNDILEERFDEKNVAWERI